MQTTRAESFGDLLRRHRLAAGLTQEALAERAGLSVRAITDLERGVRRAPYRDTVRMLAAALALKEADRVSLETAGRRPRERPASPAVADRFVPELPAPLTSLIGREREVTTGVHLLRRADVRLLTLTGPGGIGKTRVGIQVAAELREDFTDGVAFVALAPLGDPELVLPTIAQTLRLTEVPQIAWPDRLAEALRDKRLLLLLDNFEHLLSAAADIGRLLVRCPQLKVLATSRAALRLAGERELPVPPLALPEPDHPLPPEGLRRYAAIELFCQRAQAMQPAFVLTSENGAAVAAIVRRLDGLPLAIELAAARMRILGPEALLTRLEQRLPLLTGGARDLPDRQRTLRDTLAWSYHLLSEEEQALFRGLSVFVGGWTLAAAEAVCTLDGSPGTGVVDALGSLHANSLLQRAAEPEGEARFTMLETTREFAMEMLTARGEGAAWQRRHAAYYLSLAERAEADLWGPDPTETLRRLEQEHGNLRAALGWADAHDPEALLRAGGALSVFWTAGHLGEGRGWLERALARAGAAPTTARASALYALGRVADLQNDSRHAEAALEESVAAFRQLGDLDGVAGCLDYLATVLRERGEVARAALLFEESLAISREMDDPSGVAWSLLGLGQVAQDQGDLERAAALTEESLALQRSVGHQHGIAMALVWLGRVRQAQRDYARAAAHFEQAVAIWRAIRERPPLASALLSLAVLLTGGGDFARAAELLDESLRLRREMGQPLDIAYCLLAIGRLAGKTGRPERAAQLFGAGEALLASTGLSLPAPYGDGFARTVGGVRAALGEATFTAAYEAGRALSLDEAVALALQETAGA